MYLLPVWLLWNRCGQFHHGENQVSYFVMQSVVEMCLRTQAVLEHAELAGHLMIELHQLELGMKRSLLVKLIPGYLVGLLVVSMLV